MSTNSRILKTYWKAAWKYPWQVITVFGTLTITIGMLEFLPAIIVANVFDKLAAGEYTSGEVWESFGPEILAYIGLTALGGIIGWRVIIWFVWHLEAQVVRDLFELQYQHLLRLSANYHANSFSGSIVSHTNKFAHNYARLADTVVFQIYTLFIAFVATFIVLWPRAPQFVIALFLISIAFMFLSVRVTKKLRKLVAHEATTHNRSTGVLADGISNIMAVKSFAAITQEKQRYSDSLGAYQDAIHDVVRETTFKETYFSVITTMLSAAAIVLAIVSVVVFNSPVGTVFLIMSYTTIIMQRLWEFSNTTLKNLNKGLGDARDGMLMLETPLEVTDPENPEKVKIKHGAISVKNLTFNHRDNKHDVNLFEDLNIEIKAGEKIGLVGHSGSGKSSLVSLLLRFADINGGQILMDGQDITAITQDDLRRNVAYVPQEPLLFHRSVSDNIRYGNEQLSDKQVAKAAKQANAAEFIDTLVDGYDTTVGERGVKLSGGQRQRVAIARAFAKDAPILLLDEATSALDSESEQLIQDALWKLMRGRTAIVIAHRLSTIQKMDRILVMEDGRITEQGSHAELLKLKGKYADLWAHQSGGFIED